MMNQSVPNWSIDNPDTERRSMGEDNELVELLWRNGSVVQRSQAQLKQPSDFVQKKKSDGDSFMNMSTVIEEDSWLHYPLDDSLAGDFCTNYFYELSHSHSHSHSHQVDKEKDKAVKHFGASEENNVRPSRMHQSVFRQPNGFNFADNSPTLNPNQDLNFGALDKIENFPHFSRPVKAEAAPVNAPIRGSGSGVANAGDMGESSVMTIGSSHCGSNQLPNEADRSRDSSNRLDSAKGPYKESSRKTLPQSEIGLTETLETTITSSSGGSGGSYTGTDKQSTQIQRSKRKGRDADESECQSEDVEFESANTNKAPQRSGSTRRSRAAEVHNLSERRRRDRINEKMRALQELIPHCNKSDKASMLDEAIEYLKSLQLQVQMMWMGSGMAPMMFPGVQHYISQLGMGMRAHHSLPTMHTTMQLPRVPIVDQSRSTVPLTNQPAICPSVLNGVNFQNGMQNPDFSQAYARHMGFHHMQTPQPMNIYGYGSQIGPQIPKIGQQSSSVAPCQGGDSTNNTQTSKLG